MHKAFLTFIAVLTFVTVAGLARWMLDKYPDKMRTGWRRIVGAVVVGLLGVAAILMLIVLAAQGVSAHDDGQWGASDPAVREWYRSLMQPDNPESSCCGEADAYWCDDIHVSEGKTFCAITDDRPDEPRGRPHIDVGTQIEIPRVKLKWDRGNPTGHAVIFIARYSWDGGTPYVFCFVQPGGV